MEDNVRGALTENPCNSFSDFNQEHFDMPAKLKNSEKVTMWGSEGVGVEMRTTLVPEGVYCMRVCVCVCGLVVYRTQCPTVPLQ